MNTSNLIGIGAMSGTSLDGLDLAAVEFKQSLNTTQFNVLHSKFIPYSNETRDFLKSMESCPSANLLQGNEEYGQYLGKEILKFNEDCDKEPDFIASHGHTIFHQPENNFTYQLGSGQQIANITGVRTIANFRNKDVSLGGQGAPLVPIGDLNLFPNYKYCLNIGGFANLSEKSSTSIIAFDICPANYILNAICCIYFDLPYDEGGTLAASGDPIKSLYEELNKLEYYSLKPPKSLGREWVEEQINPLVSEYLHQPQNVLATFVEHISFQIGRVLRDQNGTCLVTGGGAKNSHLISRIKHYSSAKIEIANVQLIDFKEAIVFAYLGYLRLHDQVNSLSCVTGASADTSGGYIFEP